MKMKPDRYTDELSRAELVEEVERLRRHNRHLFFETKTAKHNAQVLAEVVRGMRDKDNSPRNRGLLDKLAEKLTVTRNHDHD
ncbi:hypothetical protein [Luteimonas qiangzhengi]|uniref:hypothetical protein n=1 Tax=Luteimonas sp. MJ146 TaxID=3129240 RepID=UPI0031BAB221